MCPVQKQYGRCCHRTQAYSSARNTTSAGLSLHVDYDTININRATAVYGREDESQFLEGMIDIDTSSRSYTSISAPLRCVPNVCLTAQGRNRAPDKRSCDATTSHKGTRTSRERKPLSPRATIYYYRYCSCCIACISLMFPPW